MKIAALQMVSTTDVEKNLDAARALLARAAGEGAQLAILPEYFCIMGRSDRDKLAIAEVYGSGPIQAMLAEAAREHRLWLVAGTLPLKRAEEGRAMNANLVFSPHGETVARYDKMHLFRYDNGREQYDEGRTLKAGNGPVAFDAAGLRVGLSVCYDLRFPELYRALMQPPCDLLCVPSAFTHPTGHAHWEVLLRARAIENGAFVLAPAQGGIHEDGRGTWGRTLAVAPWGEVVDKLDHDEPGVLLVDLNLSEVDRARAAIPNLCNAREFVGP
jgi:predicted amidohydrolase